MDPCLMLRIVITIYLGSFLTCRHLKYSPELKRTMQRRICVQRSRILMEFPCNQETTIYGQNQVFSLLRPRDLCLVCNPIEVNSLLLSGGSSGDILLGLSSKTPPPPFFFWGYNLVILMPTNFSFLS